MTTFPAKQISISIHRSVEAVYAFASNPLNLSKWAAGLSQSTLIQSGDKWIAESPMGQVQIRFAPPNPFGVLDHDVTLPSGEINYNPLRVVKNGDGSEVIFTLYRLPHVTDLEFERDAEMIQKDLKQMKSLLERL